MSYAFMKVLETAPRRYDSGMRLITLGRLERLYRDIVDRASTDDRVLDLGCGTGALASQLARKGCSVTAVDACPAMVRLASERARTTEPAGRIVVLEVAVTELDSVFGDASFDLVTSTLCFSELSPDEVAFALEQSHRILRPGGRLMVGDESLPDSFAGQVGTYLFRLPFAAIAYLLTQNTTRRVAGLGTAIEQAGFQVQATVSYLWGTLRLFDAVRQPT